MLNVEVKQSTRGRGMRGERGIGKEEEDEEENELRIGKS